MSVDELAADASQIFLDTNVLVYLLSGDASKAEVAESLLRRNAVVSVQVLNEFISVATRKFNLRTEHAIEILQYVRLLCRVEAITLETHELGLAFSVRFGYSIYDSMILASASLAGCRLLMSEDMQDGQSVTQDLAICNPFVSSDSGR